MTLRIVVHLGAHKTGSTSIQRHIHYNSEALLAQGIYPANDLEPRYMRKLRNNLRRAQNAGRAAPRSGALQPASQSLLRQAEKAGAHTILISDENIPGMPFHRQMLAGAGAERASLYPDAEVCVRLATEGFEDAPLTFLLYTRQQDSLLVSHYSEALQSLQITQTLEEFAAGIDLTALRFSDLLARAQRGAPDAEIKTTPFETIRGGAVPFLSGFFEDVGADPSKLTLTDENVRAKVTQATADQLIVLAREFMDGGPPQVLRRRARRLHKFADTSTPPLALPPKVIEDLRQRYADDISFKPIASR